MSKITNERKCSIKWPSGTVTWQVTEFDRGRYLLVATTAGTQFSAHFDTEQWAEFQSLIASMPA